MTKERIKSELESYIYDYQYYKEKSIERDKSINDLEKSLNRIKNIGENMKDSTIINNRLEYMLENETREEEQLLEIIQKKQLIENIIKNLEQPDRTIMYLRYIRFFTFDEIASKMNYSTKRIYQLHTIALEHYIEAYNSYLSLE